MQSYFLSLIAASMIASLVSILSPSGEKGGIAKHMKLLTALFLVCVLISPLKETLLGLRAWLDGEWELPGVELPEEDSYKQQLDQALEGASTTYFTQMLTQLLEQQFSISTGEVRCNVQWQTENGSMTPTRVTVILSGKAIWQDPEAIEEFVRKLLGCECVSAIE